MPPARTPLGRRLVGFGCLAVAIGAIEVAVDAAARWTWRVHGPTLTDARVGGLVFYGPWLVLLFLAHVVVPAWARVPWRWPRETLTAINVGVSLALLAATTVWSYVTWSGSLVMPSPTIALVSGTVAAPLVEEWLFRGLLWRSLAGTDPPPARDAAIALVVTSIAFALWHVPFPDHAPLPAHAAFGALMGLFRWRFRSLLPGALVHGAYNATYFFVPR